MKKRKSHPGNIPFGAQKGTFFRPVVPALRSGIRIGRTRAARTASTGPATTQRSIRNRRPVAKPVNPYRPQSAPRHPADLPTRAKHRNRHRPQDRTNRLKSPSQQDTIAIPTKQNRSAPQNTATIRRNRPPPQDTTPPYRPKRNRPRDRKKRRCNRSVTAL